MNRQFYIIYILDKVYNDSEYSSILYEHERKILDLPIDNLDYIAPASHTSLRFFVYMSEEELLILGLLIPIHEYKNVHNYVISKFFDNQVTEEYLNTHIYQNKDFSSVFNLDYES